MRIALVMCPQFWTKLPPLGLAALAGDLRAHGHSVDVYDLNIACYQSAPQVLKVQWRHAADTPFHDSLYGYTSTIFKPEYDRLLERLSCGAYDFIGFSLFRTNRQFTLSCMRDVRERIPDAKLILGGPEVLSQQFSQGEVWAHLIRESDSLVVGEGEWGMRVLCRAYAQNESLPEIVNEQARSLHELPFPEYSVFPLVSYERTRALPFQTSRGCIKQCTFCAERLLHNGFRTRTSDAIIRELKEAREKWGTLWFTMHDSLINGNLSLLTEWCTRCHDEVRDIKWEAQVAIRPDMTRDIFRCMKQAGCFNIFVGLESGSDTVLKRMQKGYTRREITYFLEEAYAAEMHCEVSLIVGFPEETEDEFKETMSFLEEHQRYIPKIAQINPFVPLPGTPYEHQRRREGDSRVTALSAFLQRKGFRMTEHFINNLVGMNTEGELS